MTYTTGILIEITINEYIRIIDTAKLMKAKAMKPILE